MASNPQQQEAERLPEDPWITFLHETYPDFLHERYFYPPLFFSRVPHSVKTIGGQIVREQDNPQKSGKKKNQPAVTESQPSASTSHSPSPAGSVFQENTSDLQDIGFQESDFQDDRAHFKCLQALEKIEGGMMVLSHLKFKQYNTDRCNAIPQLPSLTGPSISKTIADGECDIIIIHRQYGILIGEVKSVGEIPESREPSIIAMRVKKAIDQLNKQEIGLKHLVHDLANGKIRVTKAILLPNVDKAQLTAAVDSDPVDRESQLKQDFLECTLSPDVSTAVSKCLCSDVLKEPGTWWEDLWRGVPDRSMSDTVFESLAARFFGPASIVDIPTLGHPCRALRTLGQAVAETGLRFSSLVLMPDQVKLLYKDPEPLCVYLSGPPGCGKTVVLVLTALQWAKRGINVVLVDASGCNSALNALLEKQLRSCLEKAPAAGSILRHHWDMNNPASDVLKLLQLLPSAPSPNSFKSFVLFDEVRHREKFIEWVTAVQQQLPKVAVWAAGHLKIGNIPTHPLPAGLEVQEMTAPLRSTPAVTRQVATAAWIDDVRVPKYKDPELPLPTEGLPVRYVHHSLQQRQKGNGPGHSGSHPWECIMCADKVADILTKLRVGKPGHPQYKDVLILCRPFDNPQTAEVLANRLWDHHHVPVSVMPNALTPEDARELGTAITDQVIVAEVEQVQGLERTVVISMGDYGEDFLSWSRCTALLCIMD